MDLCNVQICPEPRKLRIELLQWKEDHLVCCERKNKTIKFRGWVTSKNATENNQWLESCYYDVLQGDNAGDRSTLALDTNKHRIIFIARLVGMIKMVCCLLKSPLSVNKHTLVVLHSTPLSTSVHIPIKRHPPVQSKNMESCYYSYTGYCHAIIKTNNLKLVLKLWASYGLGWSYFFKKNYLEIKNI